MSWHDLNEVVGYCHGPLETGDNSLVDCVSEVVSWQRGRWGWQSGGLGGNKVEGLVVMKLRVRGDE